MLFFPKLRILEVFVSPGTGLHAKLQTFLDFYFFHHVSVLQVPVFHLSDEVDVHVSQQVSLQLRHLSLELVVDELEGAVHQVPQVGQQLVIVFQG